MKYAKPHRTIRCTSRSRKILSLAAGVVAGGLLSGRASAQSAIEYDLTPIGLIGSEYQINNYLGSGGTYRATYAQHLTLSGKVVGYNLRFDNLGMYQIGADPWIYNGSSTQKIGLSGTGYEFTNAGNTYRHGIAQYSNNTGQAAGYTVRYNTSGHSLGQEAWRYNGSSTHVVGLTGSGYEYTYSGTGGGTYRYGESTGINANGYVIGQTRRYNAAAEQIGEDAWLYNGSSTQFIGLTGSGYESTYGGTGGGTYRNSAATSINAAGQVAGYSNRSAGGYEIGMDAWLRTGSTTKAIGLVGAGYEHTYFTGGGTHRENGIWELNDAGQASGASERFNSQGRQIGRDAWLYNGTSTQLIGFTGSGYQKAYTGVGGGTYRWTNAWDMNATGQVTGDSERYNSSGGSLGQDAWRQTGSTTTFIGLTGSGYEYTYTGTGGGAYRIGVTRSINDAGQVAGYAYRYNASGGELGRDAWLYTGSTTRLIGLTGGDYDYVYTGAGAGTYRYGYTADLNAAGQVAGVALRYNATGSQLGQAAWFYDDDTNSTSELAFSFRSSDNFSYTNPAILTSTGVVLGYYTLFDGTTDEGNRAFWWSKTAGFYDLGALVQGGLSAQGWQQLADVYSYWTPGAAGSTASGSPQFILGTGKILGQTEGQSVYLLTPAVGGGNWNGDADAPAGPGGNWHTAGNWSNIGAPTISDDASLNVASTYTITANSTANAKSISVSAGNVTLSLGANTLTVAENISVNSSSGTPSLTISGGQTTLGSTYRLRAGSTGNGSLTIKDGAQVSGARYLIAGDDAGATGTITITGPGTLVAVQRAYAADSGNGTIYVHDGATLQANAADGQIGIAADTGTTGSIVVGNSTANTATLRTNQNLYVGGWSDAVGGTGTLTVNSGGQVEVTGSTQVLNSASNITLNGGKLKTGSLSTVTLGNLTWNSGTLELTATNLNVGGSGPLGSNLNISSGRILNIGVDSPPSGYNLDVHNGATLTVSGGQVNLLGNGSIKVGASAGSASATFSAGSITTGYDLMVGHTGSGNFTQTGGSMTIGHHTYIGGNSGLTGSATLSGGTANLNGNFNLGQDSGTGTVNINPGATVNVGGTTKVWNAASKINLTGGTLKTGTLDTGNSAARFYSNWTGGTLELTGQDVYLSSSGIFNTSTPSIGSGKSLVLTLGSVYSGGVYVVPGTTLSVSGTGSVAANTILVQGNGSISATSGGTLSTSSTGSVLIGHNATTGTSTLSLNGGSTLNVGTTGIRVGYDGPGTMTVDGNSTVNTGILRVGHTVNGTFNHANGAVNATTLEVGYASGLIGSYTLTTGSINATGIHVGGNTSGTGGTGTLNLNGGTTTVSGTTKVYNNASKINLTGGTLKTDSLDLGGTGTRLAWSGSGTLELGGGTSNVGSLTVPSTGVLKGTGTIQGNVTNGGSFTPGNSPGTVTVQGSFTQNSSGSTTMEIGGTSPSLVDKLIVTGSSSLAGTLNIVTSSFTPDRSQSFDLFDWGSAPSGTFTTVNTPSLRAGLTWNTSQLYSTGIVSTAVTSSVTLSAGLGTGTDRGDVTVFGDNHKYVSSLLDLAGNGFESGYIDISGGFPNPPSEREIIVAIDLIQTGSIDIATLLADLQSVSGGLFTVDTNAAASSVLADLNSDYATTFDALLRYNSSFSYSGTPALDFAWDFTGTGVTLNQIAVVPEPTTGAVLLGLGALGLGKRRRRSSR